MTKKKSINEAANKAYDMLQDLFYGDPDDEMYMSSVSIDDVMKEIRHIIVLTNEQS